MHCFYRGAAVRARSDDAAEHRRDRDRNDRRIKLDCTDQPGDENHAAACHGDPPDQDEFLLAVSSSICASSWTISTRWSPSFMVAHGGRHARTATLVVVGFSVIINIVTHCCPVDGECVLERVDLAVACGRK
jgi:hypothetical protein